MHTHQDVIFIAQNEEQAVHVFDSSAFGLKNVIVFTQNIDKTVRIFTSGILRKKNDQDGFKDGYIKF